MSYNVNTGIISAPVTMDDVKRAVGYPGSANYSLESLCRFSGAYGSGGINIWAKYRPFLANRYYNNRTYYIGLQNGNSTNDPYPSDIYFTDAVSVNYYGSEGDNDTIRANYRYDEGNAMGLALATGTVNTKGKLVSTPVYWKNNSNNAIEWTFAKIDNTSCSLYDIFDPKIYRLTDFNGYCRYAKPRETFYCTESVVNNRFKIVVDSQNNNTGIKKYCLSASWFFNNSNSYNPCYGKYLGILFLKQDATKDYAFLINTRVYLINGEGTIGYFSDTNSSSFTVMMANGNNLSCSAYLARNGEGYFTSNSSTYPSTNPWWVLSKTNQNWQIEISVEDFPKSVHDALMIYSNVYDRFFDTTKLYTVQLVAVDAGIGYSDGFGNGFYLGTFGNTSQNGNYNTNIDSLNIVKNCYTISNLNFDDIGNAIPSDFGYQVQDADGNIWSPIPVIPTIYVKPTFKLSYGSPTYISNYYFKLKKITDANLISQLGGQTQYYTYYTISYNSNHYGVDDEPYFNTSISITNYVSNTHAGATQLPATVHFHLYMKKDETYSTTIDSQLSIYDGGNTWQPLRTELETYGGAYFDFAYTPEIKVDDTVMNGATQKTINVSLLKSAVIDYFSYGYVRINNAALTDLKYKMNIYYKHDNGASVVTYLLFET